MDDKSTEGSSGKPAKAVVRGKGSKGGKGKALNLIAAASGRDPAQIVKSVEEAEAKAARAAQAEEVAKKEATVVAQQATQQSHTKANDEVTAAKVYDSLSPEEQYRFECFRRCGFASKPIEKFVAKKLIEEAKKRYMARRGAMVGLGAEMSGGAGSLYDEEAPNNINSTIAAAVTDSSDGDSTKKLNSSRKRKKQSKKHILREESKRRRAAMDQPLPYFLGGGW